MVHFKEATIFSYVYLADALFQRDFSVWVQQDTQLILSLHKSCIYNLVAFPQNIFIQYLNEIRMHPYVGIQIHHDHRIFR